MAAEGVTPLFPDATAHEQFTLMLLERVDALTDSINVVQADLADAKASAQQQQQTPQHTPVVRSVRWFMRVVTVEPLPADVFADRAMRVGGGVAVRSVYPVARGAQPGGGCCHVLEAYLEADATTATASDATASDADYRSTCLDTVVESIRTAIFVDHTPVSSDSCSREVVVPLDRIADASCVKHELIQHQRRLSGLAHGVCYDRADAGEARKRDVVCEEPHQYYKTIRREYPIMGNPTFSPAQPPPCEA
jgi:hypothetical protein